MDPRIIVCGMGRTGYKIFRLLRQQGSLVKGISDCPLASESEDIVVGDPRASTTLLAAGIRSAQTLILAGADHSLNLAILVQARFLNPRIRVINRIFDSSLGEHLDRTLTDHFSMSVAALAAPIFSFAAMGNQAIGQLQLFGKTWPIHEELIDEDHPWKGKKLSELWDNPNQMLLYYLPIYESLDLVSAVIKGQTLHSGDRLLIGSKPKTHSQRGSWRAPLVRFMISLQRFREYEQPILGVILILLLTILLATFTYIFSNLNTSFVDALYFSVGMITGAGGKDDIVESAPLSIKLFTVLMMLVGAAIIGICYALLNDFVLGTRLRQFWDVARVPQRHHYIVCGLGGIGVHVAIYLHQQGHEVVVIEQDPNCRFLNTARSLRIPVLIEDASLSATLQMVNIEQAEAIIAVTSNDTVNLEIALASKGLAPRIRVVARNHDPLFARKVQHVFEFEAVLSPAELVAPTFAAAALGGRILGNGQIANSLWVALATLITENHAFCGRQVKEAATGIDFVPLYLERRNQTLHSWQLLETQLAPGDVLYLTLPANQLNHLWRVSPTHTLPEHYP